jgi:beta-lactam-binding protein with PASTA domain
MRAALDASEPTPLMDPFITPPPTTTTLPEPDQDFTQPVSGDGETVDVPDVSELSVSSAVARLEDAGLQVEQLRITSATAQPGIVMNQSPAAGSALAPGSTVWIEVTSSPVTTTTTSTTTTTTTPRGRGTDTAD